SLNEPVRVSSAPTCVQSWLHYELISSLVIGEFKPWWQVTLFNEIGDQVCGQRLNNKWMDVHHVDVSEKRNFECRKFSIKVKVKDNNDAVEKLGSSIGGMDNIIGCVSGADVVVCSVGVNQMFYIIHSRKASFVVNEDCVIENSEDGRNDFMDIKCIRSESMENDNVDYDEKKKCEIVNMMDFDESNQMGKMKVENLPNEFLEVGEVMPELKFAESVSDDAENDNKRGEAADGRTNDSANCPEGSTVVANGKNVKSGGSSSNFRAGGRKK
ncbi:23854_t:CDS:2, partial [Racocetra persica]